MTLFVCNKCGAKFNHKGCGVKCPKCKSTDCNTAEGKKKLAKYHAEQSISTIANPLSTNKCKGCKNRVITINGTNKVSTCLILKQITQSIKNCPIQIW